MESSTFVVIHRRRRRTSLSFYLSISLPPLSSSLPSPPPLSFSLISLSFLQREQPDRNEGVRRKIKRHKKEKIKTKYVAMCMCVCVLVRESVCVYASVFFIVQNGKEERQKRKLERVVIFNLIAIPRCVLYDGLAQMQRTLISSNVTYTVITRKTERLIAR